MRWTSQPDDSPGILDDSRLSWSDSTRGDRKSESWHQGWLDGW